MKRIQAVLVASAVSFVSFGMAKAEETDEATTAFETWKSHPSHFKSFAHMRFTLKNLFSKTPNVTNDDVATAKAEGWWGDPIAPAAAVETAPPARRASEPTVGVADGEPVSAWETWKSHPTHFASGEHMMFSIRNSFGKKKVTRKDIETADAQGWWGESVVSETIQTQRVTPVSIRPQDFQSP